MADSGSEGFKAINDSKKAKAGKGEPTDSKKRKEKNKKEGKKQGSKGKS